MNSVNRLEISIPNRHLLQPSKVTRQNFVMALSFVKFGITGLPGGERI